MGSSLETRTKTKDRNGDDICVKYCLAEVAVCVRSQYCGVSSKANPLIIQRGTDLVCAIELQCHYKDVGQADLHVAPLPTVKKFLTKSGPHECVRSEAIFCVETEKKERKKKIT